MVVKKSCVTACPVEWPDDRGISGRIRVEWVAGSPWNRWSDAYGMGGQMTVESADLLVFTSKGPLAPCLNSRSSRQETLRVERYSAPEPTGETTGSFCTQMRAKGFRPQPRQGSSVIAATADGFDDGHSLHQLTGGFFLNSRRPRPSAPFSCLLETVGSTKPRRPHKQMPLDLLLAQSGASRFPISR